MAIKMYCDFCQKEIKDNEGAILKSVEEAPLVMSTTGTPPPPQMMEVTKMLCDVCYKKAVKALEK